MVMAPIPRALWRVGIGKKVIRVSEKMSWEFRQSCFIIYVEPLLFLEEIPSHLQRSSRNQISCYHSLEKKKKLQEIPLAAC